MLGTNNITTFCVFLSAHVYSKVSFEKDAHKCHESSKFLQITMYVVSFVWLT